jgi:hypothetical protein
MHQFDQNHISVGLSGGGIKVTKGLPSASVAEPN